MPPTPITTHKANGNVVLSETLYKPFGEVRYTSSALPTKYTFTGQYSNVADFRLMYYGARWYDVSLGRFAQADTIIPGAGNPLAWDRYSYTLNNPVKYTDPRGHMVDDDTQGGCGWTTTPPPEPTPTPTFITYDEEYGLCFGNQCTGGSHYRKWWHEVWKPVLQRDFVKWSTQLDRGAHRVNWVLQTPQGVTLAQSPDYGLLGGYRVYADFEVEQNNGSPITLGPSTIKVGQFELGPETSYYTLESWGDKIASGCGVNVPSYLTPWVVDLSADMIMHVEDYNITTKVGVEWTARPDNWAALGAAGFMAGFTSSLLPVINVLRPLPVPVGY